MSLSSPMGGTTHGSHTCAHRHFWTFFLVVGSALYGSTMAPGLLWGDSGEAQLHVLLGGWYLQGEIVRSHVLYFALARGLRALFSLSPAFAANLASVICGAVTAANVAWLLDTLCNKRVAAACGTVLLLVSHTFWQLSAGAEVLTLTTALMTTELICFVLLIETGRLKWVFLLAFANGLGVSNHNLALLMWPVYLLVALRFRRLYVSKAGRALLPAGTRIASAIMGFVLGAAPVLALCIDDFLNRGSLAATVKSFLVGHFGPQVFNFSRAPWLFVKAMLATMLNFPTPLLLAAVPGFWAVFRLRHTPWALLLLGGALVFTLFGVRYDVPDQHMFMVPAYVFLVIFVGIGLDQRLSRKVDNDDQEDMDWGPQGDARAGRRGPLPAMASRDGLTCLRPVGHGINHRRVAVRRRLALVLCALFGPAVYALLPLVLRSTDLNIVSIPTRIVPYRNALTWFLRPWRTGYDGAERFARETLKALPPDAWLLFDTTLTWPIHYLQAAEGLKPHIRLEGYQTRQEWLPPVDVPTVRTQKLDEGKLFAAMNDPAYPPSWLYTREYELRPFGPVYQVIRRNRAESD